MVMNWKQVKRVVKKIAKQRRITENEVISEIEHAIMGCISKKRSFGR